MFIFSWRRVISRRFIVLFLVYIHRGCEHAHVYEMPEYTCFSFGGFIFVFLFLCTPIACRQRYYSVYYIYIYTLRRRPRFDNKSLRDTRRLPAERTASRPPRGETREKKRKKTATRDRMKNKNKKKILL